MKTNPPSNRPDPGDEADALRIHRHLMGDLGPEEFHQLERDLIASTGLRQRFMRAVRIDMVLRDRNFSMPQATPQAPVGSAWLQFGRMVATIAAVLILVTTIIWRMTPRQNPTSAIAVSKIATLVDARACKWAGDEDLALDNRFSAGVLELASGVAVIEFDGGARMALKGPAKLELIGPKTARLHHGNASVRCEEGLYSFSLLTPTSTVVDLGTEFGVAVNAEGSSEVHVLDGEVEVVDRVQQFEPSVRFLNAGETLALASNGTEKSLERTTHSWIRDYSTPTSRKAEAMPPKLIARDPFPNDYNQPKRFSLGTGWNGTWWQATEEKKGEHRFAPMGPLTKRDKSKGLAMVVGGWVEVRRLLAQPIDPTVAGTVYVGLSMHRMLPDSPDEAGKLSDATVLLRSSKDPTTVLGMGLSPLNYWVVSEQGGWERSDQQEKRRGPFFVIAKIEFNPLSGNKVSIKAYTNSEEIPSTEPAKWDMVTQRQHTRMLIPLDTVALRVRHSAFKFGELSLGNSWQAVVNPTSAGH